MSDGLSDSTRGLVRRAQAEGRRHGWLGTEHLLLAMLQDGDSYAGALLAGLELIPDAVRSEVDRVNATNATGLSPGQAPPTPHAKQAFARARERAGADAITCEHLLLGLIECRNHARTLLVRCGVDLASLREFL